MEAITQNLDLFWHGFLRSLGICLWGLVGSLILGTIIASFRVSPVAPLRAFGTLWVNIIRNTPLAVVLFFFTFGLPEVGVNGSYYAFAVTGLIVYTSAFVCEALRSGINAVSPGQAEAARAIGLPFGQTLTQIVLPQAFRTSIPPVGSVLIGMFKNSAVVGAFGVGGDLYAVSESLTSAQGYAALPVVTGMAVGYLLITLPAGAILSLIERTGASARCATTPSSTAPPGRARVGVPGSRRSSPSSPSWSSSASSPSAWRIRASSPPSCGDRCSTRAPRSSRRSGTCSARGSWRRSRRRHCRSCCPWCSARSSESAG
jgi:glutamate transport system permease protein